MSAGYPTRFFHVVPPEIVTSIPSGISLEIYGRILLRLSLQILAGIPPVILDWISPAISAEIFL